MEGTIKLCEDLEVDPSDVAVLVLAWKLDAKKVGEFHRAGWKSGWRDLRCVTSHLID